MKENKIVSLTDREHVLRRQSMYLGSVKPIRHENIFLEDGKFVYKEYESVDGLLKIINEIIDNSLDEAIRTNYQYANKIRVTIDSTRVSVWDNGRGIPIEKEEKTGELMPVLAFTYAKAGANFEDGDRTTVGMNGIGSFVCNCFSKVFRVKTADGKQELQLTCKRNLSHQEHVVKKSTKQYTQVTFDPDLKRFGLEEIDDLHRTLIEQRIIHLSMCHPQIQFKFNGKIPKIRRTRDYLKAFSEDYVFIENDNYVIAITPNDSDDFRQTSFINGLDVQKGGNHIDLITWEMTSRIREKVKRKYKSIKPGDIKNKLRIIVIFRNFTNFESDSQTKERLTNSTTEIRDYLQLEAKDWEKMAMKIYRTESIFYPIIESFKIKEELKQRKALKDLNKQNQRKKKVRCDKYLPPIKDNTFLALCEGDSAKGSLMPVLGRDNIGYFAMRGVPLNSYEVHTNKLLANKELNNIILILGIRLGQKEQQLNFDNILLSQDADADGAHIAGLLIGFFHRYAPSVLKEGRIKKLRTPIVVLKKKGKIEKFFFDLVEYREFEKTHGVKGYQSEYKKGLGSWKKDDLKALVEKHGFDYFVETLEYDEQAEELIHNWLSNTTSDRRKEYIQQVPFDIDAI
jgi:DNA topoisomerase-2